LPGNCRIAEVERMTPPSAVTLAPGFERRQGALPDERLIRAGSALTYGLTPPATATTWPCVR
jgi:hypothetical protein